MMIDEQMTPTDIAQQYSSMGDSVNLINKGKPLGMSDEEWLDTKARNQEHLKLMVAKDYWTDEDMTAANVAINA